MAFEPMQDETVVREYNYAHGKLIGMGKVSRTLIITNKRLVSTTEGAHYIKRDDISLMNVKAVNGTYRNTWRLIAVLLLLLGVAVSCYAVMGILSKAVTVKAFLIALVIAIAMFVISGIIPKNHYLDLEMEFYPDHPGREIFSLNAVSTAPAVPRVSFWNLLFHRKPRNRLRVDGEKAKLIINEIAAVLMQINQEREQNNNN